MNGKDKLLLAAKVRAVKLEFEKCDGRRLRWLPPTKYLSAVTGGMQ